MYSLTVLEAVKSKIKMLVYNDAFLVFSGREQKPRKVENTLSLVVRRLGEKGSILAILVQCRLSIPQGEVLVT